MVIPLFLAAAVIPRAIDVSGFNDSRHHWRNIKQPERIMQALPNQPSYRPEQVREIAENVLLFQRENGGWVKDYDMLAVLTEEQKKQIRDTRANNDTSYDNHTVHPQVEYLARAFVMLGVPAYRQACERGIDFMVASQYENGGFPQRWPRPTGIGAHITFNDGVMMGILSVLHDAAHRAPHFTWLDEARREKARAAVEKGVACIRKMQIVAHGVLTGWGQQHDHRTLAPAAARAFEPPCLSPADTVDIVRILMRDPRPPVEVLRAMDAAVAWLGKVRLTGIRVERVPAPPAEYFRHSTNYDVVVVQDETAPPLWPRIVEIGSDRAIFADRTGKIAYALADIDRERRTGSGWFVTSPQQLVDRDYPKWRAKVR